MSSTLQQKNTGFLFNRLALVLLGSCVLFYFLMRMQARHMQEKQLLLTQAHIEDAFRNNPTMPMNVPGEYTITEQANLPAGILNKVRDTSFLDAATQQHLPFAILTDQFFANGKKYQLTTYVSSTEIGHLIIKVFLIEACILGLLFIVIIYINRKTSGRLWQPFRKTMNQLAVYDITQNKPLTLDKETGIAEFNELNKALITLVERNSNAYTNQKQFVENASHEIQTPLAVIRSKLELLINQQNITEETASLLCDITEANDRLSQMNKSLLLLAKIENNQFPVKQRVDLRQMIDNSINNYHLQYPEDFPKIHISAPEQTFITANPSLMEILIGNLIKNAIVHNITNGSVEIDLSPDSLSICNTGAPIFKDPQLLFGRFSKGNDTAKSTGLGLALVKQICQINGFKPNYIYEDGWHSLRVEFGSEVV